MLFVELKKEFLEAAAGTGRAKAVENVREAVRLRGGRLSKLDESILKDPDFSYHVVKGLSEADEQVLAGTLKTNPAVSDAYPERLPQAGTMKRG